MRHKLQDLAHTLTVYVNTVKDGVTSIFTHPMMLSFRLCLCSLWDLVIISSLSLAVTFLLPTVIVTSEIPLLDLKDLRQHHLQRIRRDRLRMLSHPSRSQMLMKSQSTGSRLIL